jgi:hypothetical protein
LGQLGGWNFTDIGKDMCEGFVGFLLWFGYDGWCMSKIKAFPRDLEGRHGESVLKTRIDGGGWAFLQGLIK